MHHLWGRTTHGSILVSLKEAVEGKVLCGGGNVRFLDEPCGNVVGNVVGFGGEEGFLNGERIRLDYFLGSL
jgi:hypothetical protein